jgi:hypothetical protein
MTKRRTDPRLRQARMWRLAFALHNELDPKFQES